MNAPRRHLLTGAAAVAFLGTLPLAGLAAGSPAIPDPLLDLIRACRAGNDAYNALRHPNDAAITLTYGPPYAALSHAPAATTRTGAVEALRFLCEELEHTHLDAAPIVIAAALAYFDGEAA
ncbi:hypothetical protein [Azorhizobium doebereinerae]|uniref:hypothetical protein n=1 Tax=Azorhizobium doebereinerae TaxID=281091 RepID=UPI0004065D97|nr:hypothetical protein [Azorhizobium doebereinerae]